MKEARKRGEEGCNENYYSKEALEESYVRVDVMRAGESVDFLSICWDGRSFLQG